MTKEPEGNQNLMEQPTLNQSSPSWLAFVNIAFVIALGLMVTGIILLPVNWWMRGYLLMGLFFTVSSTITLSKTMRDDHEAKKITHRLGEIKTERLLKEFDLKG